MALQFGLLVPQGWTMDLAHIKDPVEAYETMTRVAQTADEVGFASAWLVDHFHTIPHPSQEVTFEGKYYQVRGAINQPKGVQQPHIPLLIGGDGEKVTLKLVAQYADACNVGDDPASVKQKLAVLKQHCETVGRDYESIRRTSSTFCLLADSDEQALALLPAELKARLGERVKTALIGSAETIRQRLAAYEAAGVQDLLLRLVGGTNLVLLRRFPI